MAADSKSASSLRSLPQLALNFLFNIEICKGQINVSTITKVSSDLLRTLAQPIQARLIPDCSDSLFAYVITRKSLQSQQLKLNKKKAIASMNRTSRSASNEDRLVQSCVARVTASLQNQLKEIVKEALSAIKQEQQLEIDSLKAEREREREAFIHITQHRA